MTTINWKQIGVATEYVVWVSYQENTPIFQVTKGETPTSDGGYYSLASILKLKGVTGKFIGNSPDFTE